MILAKYLIDESKHFFDFMSSARYLSLSETIVRDKTPFGIYFVNPHTLEVGLKSQLE